jgi:tRNA pseudouridine13 synthase
VGEYTHFTLEKKNWDTMRAAKAISRACGVSHKRMKYAGTKDRRSISTQRMSIWNVPPERLEKVNIKDLTLRDFSTSDEPVNLGTLQGNRFTIILKGVSEDADEKVDKIVKELDGKAPNFYGTQRFGNRLNNHWIGKHILRGEFKEAAMAYLCDIGDEPEESIKFKEALLKDNDFKKAFKNFPNYLGYEKSMLNYLAKEPTDFVGALRELPKKLRWMFVHAYQGYIFNLAVSECIEKGKIPKELPLVGYDSKPDRITAEIMRGEDITTGEFKVASMPESSTPGLMRDASIDFKDFEVLEFDKNKKTIKLRFSLPPGSYATILLREIMK